MKATCKKKFPFTVEGETKIYRPGDVIEGDAADWAVSNSYGKETAEQAKAAEEAKAAEVSKNKVAKPAANKAK